MHKVTTRLLIKVSTRNKHVTKDATFNHIGIAINTVAM